MRAHQCGVQCMCVMNVYMIEALCLLTSSLLRFYMHAHTLQKNLSCTNQPTPAPRVGATVNSGDVAICSAHKTI